MNAILGCARAVAEATDDFLSIGIILLIYYRIYYSSCSINSLMLHSHGVRFVSSCYWPVENHASQTMDKKCLCVRWFSL